MYTWMNYPNSKKKIIRHTLTHAYCRWIVTAPHKDHGAVQGEGYWTALKGMLHLDVCVCVYLYRETESM